MAIDTRPPLAHPAVQVSVLVPTRNRPLETLRAVRSALDQTLPPLEVIVVDDGSEDQQLLVTTLREIGDDRLRIHLLDRNYGGSYARNRAVELAQGSVVAFLDSDDEWLPDKLSHQVVDLAKHGKNAVVYCRYEALTSDGTRRHVACLPTRAKRMNESIGEYLFCHRGSIATPTIVLYRALAKAVPFDPTLVRHQEFGLLLKLERAGCVFHMSDRVLARIHWEDLGRTRRHVNPIASTYFFHQYGRFVSAKARGGFWLTMVVYPQFFETGYGAGMRSITRRWEVFLFLALRPRELLKVLLFAAGLPPTRILRFARAVKVWVYHGRSEDSA